MAFFEKIKLATLVSVWYYAVQWCHS